MLLKFLSANVLVTCGSSPTALPFCLLLRIFRDFIFQTLLLFGSAGSLEERLGGSGGSGGQTVGSHSLPTPTSAAWFPQAPWAWTWQVRRWQVFPALHWTSPAA